MISTKNLISDLDDVPREWIFEHYLKLTEKLCGQDIKIKSIFVIEKTPSMCIYMDERNRYRYKDFSSGNGGDALDLVEKLFNLKSRGAASFKILDDYNDYLSSNGPRPVIEYTAQGRYKVTDYEMRHWTNLDKNFWTNFYITSGELERYNVTPLAHYALTKEDEQGILSQITIKGNYIYGYFKEDGTLYKIYQPRAKDNKFIKVKDYIQGSEQLTHNKSYLIILSSLKDLLAFNQLGINNIEAVAPDSENAMISDDFMRSAIKHYKKVMVLFDNDEPGKNASIKYSQKHKINSINLELSKDLSDSVRDYGIEKAREALFSLLKKAIQ